MPKKNNHFKKNKMKKEFSVLISLLLTISLQAQIDLSTGLKYKAEKKWSEAYDVFKILLKNDSSEINYLTNMSYLSCKIGNLTSNETDKQNYFKKALYLSKKAIATQTTSAQAHYTMAMALGRINENASSKQKITNAKVIRTECEEAIKYDPKLAGAYHILGRWHRTIAGFNFIEKAAINTLYGGVPDGGSYEAAIDNFSKAILLEPNEIIHKYELAETYSERNNKGDDILANVWFKKVLELKPTDQDDVNHQTLAKQKIK